MMKKIVILVSFLVILPISTMSSFAAAPVQVIINNDDGKNYPISQFTIKDNRLYGSIETVSSMMGASFDWVFKDKKSVSFVSHFSPKGSSDEFYTWFNKSKKVEIGSHKDKDSKIRTLTMNNLTITSKDGEILIPLRDAIVALGKSINWDSKTNMVTVTGKIVY